MNQLKQQHNYIISLSGPSLDISIANIAEANNFILNQKKRVLLLSEKELYKESKTIPYSLIMNATTAQLRRVDNNNKPYIDTFPSILEKFENGLLIAESDTISQSIVECLCQIDLDKKNMDVIVCHNYWKDMFAQEIQKATFLKIYANNNIDQKTALNIQALFAEKAPAILVAQSLANYQYDKVTSEFKRQKEEYTRDGLTDIIHYNEYSMQLNFFVYINLADGKIINIEKFLIRQFLDEQHEALGIKKEMIKTITNLISPQDKEDA